MFLSCCQLSQKLFSSPPTLLQSREVHTREISFNFIHNFIVYLHTFCKPHQVSLLLTHASPWHIPLGKLPLQDQFLPFHKLMWCKAYFILTDCDLQFDRHLLVLCNAKAHCISLGRMPCIPCPFLALASFLCFECESRTCFCTGF